MGTPADTINRSISTSRIVELDGLRGVAVLLVLIHHLVVHSAITRNSFVDLYTFKLAESAWIGVDLFFVLSGFLITGILYDSKNVNGYFRNFYSRRALRIFPLYFGFLAFSLAVVPSLMPEDAHLWYWTYLSNIYIVIQNGWPDPPHLSHFWSLAIEEQFYLLWPLAVLALDRRQLIRLSIACMTVAFVLRIIMLLGMSPLDGYMLLPTRMDALTAGAIVALLIRCDEGRNFIRTWAAPVLYASGIVIIALFLHKRGFRVFDPLVQTFGYTFLAVAAASLIGILVTANDKRWLRRGLSMPWLTQLGKYSYGIYVLHHPIIFVLRDAGFDARLFPQIFGSSLPGVLIFAAVAGCITLISAMLSYHYWELPFLKMKELFPYSRTAESRAVAKRKT
jgi:peptidoglycan/LPS O-acetylase OafA/YrhL